MKDDVLLSLAIATQFAHHASYAGAPRQAIADGYSAIDAVLSALLLSVPEEPPRNHKAKLIKAKQLFPKIFDEHVENTGSSGISFSGGVPWADIEEFYVQWLDARYAKFDVPANEARQRVMQANRVVDAAKRYIAGTEKVEFIEVDNAVRESAFGFGDSEHYQALSDAHDHLFQKAEELGERLGRKLGIKMADVTNFCDLDLVAGDQATVEIIKADKAIASECAAIYIRLCALTDDLRNKRCEKFAKDKGVDISDADVVNASPDFMFSLKFKYHGETTVHTAANLAALIGKAVGRIKAGKSNA